ncbi:MAG: MTH938/NDUFAF3 family protein [Bacteroidota bacterium]
MYIDSYEFGKMTIGGREYTEDLMVLPSKIIPTWQRDDEQHLQLPDIKDSLDKVQPDAVVIGTGNTGGLEVDKEVIEYLEKKNIELVIENTDKAVNSFNTFDKQNIHVLGAFHLI